MCLAASAAGVCDFVSGRSLCSVLMKFLVGRISRLCPDAVADAGDGDVAVGVQFLLMGLLAEMLVRTYHESQAKSIYAVREKIGFE